MGSEGLRMLDLFSGIGGFSLAAERCGVETVAFCEKEPFCRRVLARHWPGVTIYEDVRAVEPLGLGRIDIISGGFPCQDLSVAGKRAGLSGERSGLFWEIIRLADALRPSWLVLENVPGLLSSGEGRDMGLVVGALRDLGYLGAWRVLDAQWFGVAQRRRRVFLVGCLGEQRLATVLPFLASGNGHPAPRRQARQDLAPTLDVRAGRSGETSFHTSGGLAVSSPTAPALRARSNDPHRDDMAAYVAYRMQAFGQYECDFTADAVKSRDYKDATDLIAHTLRGEGFDAGEDGTGRGTPLVVAAHETGQGWWNEGPIAGTLRREGEDRPSRPANVVTCSTSSHASETALAFQERGRDGGRDLNIGGDTAYALTAPTGGGRRQEMNIATQSQVRRLTPTECERLQGFSWRDRSGEWQDGHTCLCGRNHGRSVAPEGEEPCKCPDGPRYRACGNAVAVPNVEWIMWRVVEAESAQDPALARADAGACTPAPAPPAFDPQPGRVAFFRAENNQRIACTILARNAHDGLTVRVDSVDGRVMEHEVREYFTADDWPAWE